MTSCIAAAAVTQHLTRHRHPSSTNTTSWQPGHRVQQASPRTVRIWHDGPDEQQYLDQYALVLRAAGYTVTAEQVRGKRPALRVTRF